VPAVSQQPEAMTGNEDERLQQAIALAVAARASAYARYSGFAMGAAVVDIEGRSTRGVLVENVSLGLSMCAERVALFTAVTEAVTPAVLAVCAPRTGGQLTFPCGACLQVGLEVAGTELLIVAVDCDGVHERAPLLTLLTRAPKRHTPITGPATR
jgi:cytidine deaminase